MTWIASFGNSKFFAVNKIWIYLLDLGLLLLRKARRKEREGDQSSSDTKLYLEENVLERKLPDADLKTVVDIPVGLDYNEWLASHTLSLFEHVNLVYGTISEFCTTSGCSDMTGPGNRIYLWFDEKGKKTRVAAPQYIDYVMTFTQKTVSDETIFPTKYAKEFPSSFESIARKILRLLFHVIAHLYAAHFREIALLGLHTHLNLTFAHLTALRKRFNLIDSKETDVLRDLEIALRLTDDPTVTNLVDQQHQQASSSSASLSTSIQYKSSNISSSINVPNCSETNSISNNSNSNNNNNNNNSNNNNNYNNNNNNNKGINDINDKDIYDNNNNNNINDKDIYEKDMYDRDIDDNNNDSSNNNSNNDNSNNDDSNNDNSNNDDSNSNDNDISNNDNDIDNNDNDNNNDRGDDRDSQMTSLIDGDASIQPICTQPESGVQPNGDQIDFRDTVVAVGIGSTTGGNGGGASLLRNSSQISTHSTAA